jgi:hypothetical protein
MLEDLRNTLDLGARVRLAEAETKKKAARELVIADGRSAQSDALVRAALADVRAAAQMIQIGGFLSDAPPTRTSA